MVLIFYKKKRDKELKELLSYLKRISKKNYKIEIKKNSEGDYSLLLNELYKTAVMLNEQSELSRKDKESLKNSLSDISHQLRTPLTSINLMIDNVMNEDTSEAEKKKLLRDINHKIKNTSFLIENLLKLSKFDANTINFKKEYIYVSKILDDVKDNLSLLLDLKDINLNISGDKKIRVNVDPKWEVEAISNIVKNAIEYSNESSKIDITYEHNDIFTKLVIRDYGCGMSKKDQKHIFERFYKGEKSSGNSIGIGMSLAKMIIEKDNGTINVESSEEGTKFIIKYFNN
jgi:signal transduction histidine kinase